MVFFPDSNNDSTQSRPDTTHADLTFFPFFLTTAFFAGMMGNSASQDSDDHAGRARDNNIILSLLMTGVCIALFFGAVAVWIFVFGGLAPKEFKNKPTSVLSKIMVDARFEPDPMRPKAYGTCQHKILKPRWGCDEKLANFICCYNDELAEQKTDWLSNKAYQKDIKEYATLFPGGIMHRIFSKWIQILVVIITVWTRINIARIGWRSKNTQPITYYDSVTGKPLFRAPVGRTWESWYDECQEYGWPSFRDQEIYFDNGTTAVRMQPDGEIVNYLDRDRTTAECSGRS